jgi:RHS repeat-associated protein
MYTGRRYDFENSTYHYRNRTYNPSLGRFMQPDPTGTDGGINLYEYAAGDPINKTDPTGNCPSCVWGAVIGFGVDFAAQTYVAHLNGQSVFDTYDWRQGLVATGLGAVTGGVSAFAGSAIEGTGALAFGARTVANAAIGASGSVAGTAILNNWENRDDSYVSAALWGGAFGAAGSAVGDAISGVGRLTGFEALRSEGLSPGNANKWQTIADQSGYEFMSVSPRASTLGTVVGGTVGNLNDFIPNGDNVARAQGKTR